MDPAVSCSVGFWVVLLFVISFQQTWASKQPQHCVSSCGEIANISHPFRLKGDPKRCGQRKYEVDCINNVAVVRLFAGEYYVKAINYNNFTIRLLDPNIQESDCSSLPRYFLYQYNFSSANYFFGDESDDAPYHAFQRMSEYGYYGVMFDHVIYLTCKDPVNSDAFYVNTTSCLDQYTYVIVGDLPVNRLKFGCHVKLVATYTDNYGSNRVTPKNVSYTDIHKELAHGFELSWLHSVCADYGCGSASCYVNQTDRKVQFRTIPILSLCLPDHRPMR